MAQSTNYIKRLLDADDSASIKRFTILIGLTLFTLNNLYSLFSKTTLANLQLISDNNDHCFMIIAVGVFGLGVEAIRDWIVAKAKAKATSDILGPGYEPDAVDPGVGPLTTTTTTKTSAKKTAKKRALEDPDCDKEEDPNVLSELNSVKVELLKSLKAK